MKEITTAELQDKLEKDAKVNVLDVRRDDEIAEGIVPGAKHIVLDELPERFNELNKEEPIYIICRSGGRSQKACEFLEGKGYDVSNVTGGMLDWEGATE